MSVWTNSTATTPSGGTTYSQGPAVIAGGTDRESCFLYCPTARSALDSPSGANSVFEPATRTATTCFMKGYKDAIEIQVADGLPWQWRRITFTMKNLSPYVSPTVGAFEYAVLTSNGYTRVLNQVPGTGTTGERNGLYGLIFKGSLGNDWTDPLTAPTDNSRVTIKSDITQTIASNNERGVIRKYNRYYKMEKNLVYNDDEVGGKEFTSSYSVSGKAGMGDYFIVDIFRPRTGSTGDNQLALSMTGTLYWHEK